MRKKLILLVLLLIIAVMGGWKLRSIFAERRAERTVSAETIVGEIKKVAKLVTVEGHISEIYSMKELAPLLGLPLYSEKKLLAKVSAKVLVGYDLSKVDFEINDATKTIKILSLPEPEIMAIDESIKYHDISEGYWNEFSEEDYSKIQKDIKDMIREAALKSDLIPKAKEQALNVLTQAGRMIRESGWTLVLPDALHDVRAGGLPDSLK